MTFPNLKHCDLFLNIVNYFLFDSVNVAKWEKSMAEDEKEIEKLKKEEKKHVAVRLTISMHFLSFVKYRNLNSCLFMAYLNTVIESILSSYAFLPHSP